MKKLPNNNYDNIVFALIAVTGLSVASQSGLAGQLFQVLDQTLVKSASAQNIRLQREQRVAPSDNIKLQELEVNRIQILDDQAYQITEDGDRKPLEDGYYKFPSGEVLTLESGRIINREMSTKDCAPMCPFEEAGWRDGNIWERDTSGDEMTNPGRNLRDNIDVRDTFNRVQPEMNRMPSRDMTPNMKR